LKFGHGFRQTHRHTDTKTAILCTHPVSKVLKKSFSSRVTTRICSYKARTVDNVTSFNIINYANKTVSAPILLTK